MINKTSGKAIIPPAFLLKVLWRGRISSLKNLTKQNDNSKMETSIHTDPSFLFPFLYIIPCFSFSFIQFSYKCYFCIIKKCISIIISPKYLI